MVCFFNVDVCEFVENVAIRHFLSEVLSSLMIMLSVIENWLTFCLL